MSSVPQSYINQILSQNNSDVLDGSVIQIIGMNFAADGSSSGQWGDTPHPENYRYVSWFSPNTSFPGQGLTFSGATYSSMNDFNIQWLITSYPGTTNVFQIQPNISQGTWLTSGNYPNNGIPVVFGQANSSNPNSDWLIALQDSDPLVTTNYNGVDYTPIRIVSPFNNTQGWSNSWTSPNKGGNFQLIVANSLTGTQLISVVTPGPKLLASYCQGSNLGTTACYNFCIVGAGNCTSKLINYCQGTNLEQDICFGYCQDKNNNCDLFLENYCASKLSAAGGNYTTFLNDPDNVKLCGCFLDQTVYQSFAKQLQLTWQIPASVNVTDCFFPPCANATGLTPYNWKNGPQNCPSTCINAVIINNDGTIGPISFNQSNNCGGTAVDPNKPPTPPPKPKPPHKPKPSPKHDNGLVALLGLIFLIVIVVSFAVLFLRHQHPNRSRNERPRS